MSVRYDMTRLTDSDLELLRMKRDGKTYIEIGKALGYSQQTIQNRVNQIAATLGFRDLSREEREKEFTNNVYPYIDDHKQAVEETKEEVKSTRGQKILIFLGGVALGIALTLLYYSILIYLSGGSYIIYLPWDVP